MLGRNSFADENGKEAFRIAAKSPFVHVYADFQRGGLQVESSLIKLKFTEPASDSATLLFQVKAMYAAVQAYNQADEKLSKIEAEQEAARKATREAGLR